MAASDDENAESAEARQGRGEGVCSLTLFIVYGDVCAKLVAKCGVTPLD